MFLWFQFKGGPKLNFFYLFIGGLLGPIAFLPLFTIGFFRIGEKRGGGKFKKNPSFTPPAIFSKKFLLTCVHSLKIPHCSFGHFVVGPPNILFFFWFPIMILFLFLCYPQGANLKIKEKKLYSSASVIMGIFCKGGQKYPVV